MSKLQRATFGGGCFWCLEAVFVEVRGVSSVVSGYAGGQTPNPTYKEVCGGRTGHAEVVQITFDPEVVSYRDLLGVFFGIHDPTTANRQGNDAGTQYRSAIYTEGPEQAATAAAFVSELEQERVFPGPLTTEVAPLDVFYPAEDYHQNYFRDNPYQPYCMAVVAPKVAKFRKQFLDRLVQR